MASKYVRDPSPKDFLEWSKANPELFKEFYKDHLLDLILDLEQDDYFGTEGFDKRFG
jgi:hypothetical protein